VREYCYHILTRRDRDRFHQGAALYFEQEQNWLAAGHHHFERRDYNTALSQLTEHAETIINAGQLRALSDLLARFNSVTLTPEQRVQLYQAQGNCLRIRGEYQLAVAALEAAREETTAEEVRADIFLQIATVHVTSGEYARSTPYLRDSLERFEQLGQTAGIANAHRYLGWVHYRQGRFDQAQQHFTVGEQIARQIQDKHLLADIGLGTGSVLWKKGDLATAQTYFEESRRIFRDLGDRFGESTALNNLGIVYGFRGDLPGRIAQHLQAIQIAESIGYVHSLSLSLNNLAHAYFLNEQYEQAAESYTRLAQLSRSTGYTFTLSLACAGLADSYLAQGQPEEALQQAEAAYDSAAQSGGQIERGVSYRVLGDVWLALANGERARQFYEQSIPLLTEAGEAEDLARAQRGLARIQAESDQTS